MLRVCRRVRYDDDIAADVAYKTLIHNVPAPDSKGTSVIVLFTDTYYLSLSNGARRSANEIVPLLIDFVAPRSVVDIGCGDGTWLDVFRENGVSAVLGVDGAYVNPERLQIARENFRPHDLLCPLCLPQRFDLVVSLEVGQYLPAESAAEFVRTLTRLGPAVLFSSAVPLQSGAHHRNSQWPGFWADLFASHNWVWIDCIRPQIWENENVYYWYAQNTVLYVDADRLADYPYLQNWLPSRDAMPPALVHPRAWALAHSPRRLLRELPVAIRKAIGRRIDESLSLVQRRPVKA